MLVLSVCDGGNRSDWLKMACIFIRLENLTVVDSWHIDKTCTYNSLLHVCNHFLFFMIHKMKWMDQNVHKDIIDSHKFTIKKISWLLVCHYRIRSCIVLNCISLTFFDDCVNYQRHSIDYQTSKIDWNIPIRLRNFNYQCLIPCSLNVI